MWCTSTTKQRTMNESSSIASHAIDRRPTKTQSDDLQREHTCFNCQIANAKDVQTQPFARHASSRRRTRGMCENRPKPDTFARGSGELGQSAGSTSLRARQLSRAILIGDHRVFVRFESYKHLPAYCKNTVHGLALMQTKKVVCLHEESRRPLIALLWWSAKLARKR